MTETQLQEFTNWLIKRNLTLNTVQGYLKGPKKYGHREINTTEITNFLKANLTKYEPNTLKLFRQGLSSYAKFQKIDVEWELITKIIPTIQPRFFATINKEELEQLKQADTTIDKDLHERNNLMLDFLLYTGLRINELINIRHCDYQAGSLRILGKGNKIRYLPIPDFLVKYFRPYSRDYLFTTNHHRQKLSNSRARTIIYEKTKKSGMIKNISPHTFRRSFATLCNNKNIHLTTIQKILGHSQITTTSNYIHNSYEEIYKDYSKLWIVDKKETF